jgi:hypothetical protein
MSCLRRAVRSVVDQCLTLQYNALRTFEPDVCVGSSWGGALLIYAILRNRWKGPTLLLAPAHYKVHRYTVYDDLPRDLSFQAGPTSSVSVRPFPLHIIHGSSDEKVPLTHSKRLFGMCCLFIPQKFATLTRADDFSLSLAL